MTLRSAQLIRTFSRWFLYSQLGTWFLDVSDLNSVVGMEAELGQVFMNLLLYLHCAKDGSGTR